MNCHKFFAIQEDPHLVNLCLRCHDVRLFDDFEVLDGHSILPTSGGIFVGWHADYLGVHLVFFRPDVDSILIVAHYKDYIIYYESRSYECSVVHRIPENG